jgi:hypothetical protein
MLIKVEKDYINLTFDNMKQLTGKERLLVEVSPHDFFSFKAQLGI